MSYIHNFMKKLCLHDDDINECARIIFVVFEVILHLKKNLRLDNLDTLEKFKRDQALNKKYIAERDVLKRLGVKQKIQKKIFL